MIVGEFQTTPRETKFYFAACKSDDKNLILVLNANGLDTRLCKGWTRSRMTMEQHTT